MAQYIHNLTDWPRFQWSHEALVTLLPQVRHHQGRLAGAMESIGFELQEEAFIEVLSQDAVKSSAIEGEILDEQQVRSSIASRLGIDIGGLVPVERHVDGVVEMLLDATQNWQEHLTEERLFGWHAALFPTGRSGLQKIQVGRWRADSTGPMQVVSGPMGRERVHFEAPASDRIASEMRYFLEWFNQNQDLDPVLKAAIAHLWFITIHPFDDGNGRIARAISDLALCRSEASAQRFYSMSMAIEKQKKGYYRILETSQKGDLDITPWLQWFLECLSAAMDASSEVVHRIMAKHRFWNVHKTVPFNERQMSTIERLFGGFFGHLTTSKWARINKCSQDTALRDIQDLVDKQVLQKTEAGGRSTRYVLIAPGFQSPSDAVE